MDSIIINSLEIIAPELAKKIKEIKHSEYTFNGFWYSLDGSTTDVKSIEVLEIRQKNNRIKVKLLEYRMIEGGKLYKYTGVGDSKLEKICFTCVSENKRSNQLGSFILRIVNEGQHTSVLDGKYCEYKGRKFTTSKYVAKRIDLSLCQRFKMKFKKRELLNELFLKIHVAA